MATRPRRSNLQQDAGRVKRLFKRFAGPEQPRNLPLSEKVAFLREQKLIVFSREKKRFVIIYPKTASLLLFERRGSTRTWDKLSKVEKRKLALHIIQMHIASMRERDVRGIRLRTSPRKRHGDPTPSNTIFLALNNSLLNIEGDMGTLRMRLKKMYPSDRRRDRVEAHLQRLTNLLIIYENIVSGMDLGGYRL